jgi:hypothetical protein
MRLRTLLYSATAALMAGCTPVGSCTLIGCYDGLAVDFNRAPEGAFRIEVTTPGDPTVHAIDCTSAASCVMLFPDLIAEQVTVRAILQQGTVTQTFQPDYQDLYPNGRRCGAACRQASVIVQLPA